MEKDILERLVSQGLCQREIAKELDVSKKKIEYWMNKYSIRTLISKSRKPRRLVSCKNCEKKTKNDIFCSRSCAAIWNNTHYVKRKKKQYYCKTCEKKVGYRRKYCDGCIPSSGYGENPTLRDVITISPMSSPYSLVRLRARNIMKDEPKVCEVCKYDIHTEICHIKHISDFDLDCKLSEVNARSNLKTLCPNCHWEFDNL